MKKGSGTEQSATQLVMRASHLSLRTPMISNSADKQYLSLSTHFKTVKLGFQQGYKHKREPKNANFTVKTRLMQALISVRIKIFPSGPLRFWACVRLRRVKTKRSISTRKFVASGQLKHSF